MGAGTHLLLGLGSSGSGRAECSRAVVEADLGQVRGIREHRGRQQLLHMMPHGSSASASTICHAANRYNYRGSSLPC
eukprot:scaffold210267_cov19-Prasinocladus_malaysianus.AAC.3